MFLFVSTLARRQPIRTTAPVRTPFLFLRIDSVMKRLSHRFALAATAWSFERTTQAAFLPPSHRHLDCGRSLFYPLSLRHFSTSSTTASSSSFERTPEEESMTQDSLAILTAAIDAVDPYRAVKRHVVVSSVAEDTLQILQDDTTVYNFDMNDFDTVLILSFGKASSRMAQAVVEQVSATLTPTTTNSKTPAIEGVVVAKDDHVGEQERKVLAKIPSIHILEASHPVPDERSVQGAARILDLARAHADPRTLVITCISGGGSALCCHPKPPLTLQDLQVTNSLLLASGMSIDDMNVIRKRLEDVKGGQLAIECFPSTLITLVLSDVLGDPLDLIASGPTVPDTSCVQDVWDLIERYELGKTLPERVIQLLQLALKGNSEDTPSPAHPAFQTSKNPVVLVGNNERAVLAAADEATERGYNTVVLGTRIEGEAREVAGVYAAMAQHLSQLRDAAKSPYAMTSLPAALIGGGETTVTLSTTSGSSSDSIGKGGRNQELALVAAQKLQSLALRNVVVASVGTDGTDGPTDAAGAVVDGGTIRRLDALGDYTSDEALQRHDAYTYLKQTEADGNCPLIVTGPTGTNVADVCVVLVR